MRTGLEFNFDGFGTESLLAIQSGYNSAGASGGISVNLGILQLAVASEAVDIGLGNNSVLERRSVATLTVNISEE